jgi:hypothetical protein
VKSFLPIAFLAAVLLLTGCERRVFWSYRDDPYLHNYAVGGEKICVESLGSLYLDDRQVALRVLAENSARARAAGDVAQADRLLELILRRYKKDRSAEIRSCIISLCLPVCGCGSKEARDFLCQLLAGGAWSEPAAIALASITPEQAFPLLEPMTKHPSPLVRYEAAMALTVLGDERGEAIVRDIIAEMASNTWPQSIHDLPKSLAAATLSARADRAWRRHGKALPLLPEKKDKTPEAASPYPPFRLE